ncbi:MAG: 2-oxo acid dehydrogenase subunit E2 [Bacteroidetes bacterium]|nr:2-oxo acid dehydrogenase subunit E2 [Bacteroidota bacterium]
MSKYELKLPKMGESVAEATITGWLKEVGEPIEMDEAILEIATDKVDSEVPSEVNGILIEKRFNVDDVVQVGQTIAIIETADEEVGETIRETDRAQSESVVESVATIEEDIKAVADHLQNPATVNSDVSDTERFYSPLVRSIAKEENVTVSELNQIAGSGKDGRVTKDDLLGFIQHRVASKPSASTILPKKEIAASNHTATAPAVKIPETGDTEIIEMDRMRKLIAQHMTHSKQTSAHVQSFVEVDVTNLVKWRDREKVNFEKKEGEKLTFTPIFIEAVAKALRDYPMMNISVDGDKLIRHKNIHIGMATALPSGNLIVPVIKNADQRNLVGLAKAVNDLADRARNNKLKPDDTQGGTYTITNVGTFGSIMGTPIINQPQVGILAFGAIRKVPAVIETPEGDFIGIRQKMFLSHSYDHRVVDGALGGMFVRKVADYLEAWDMHRNS